MTNETISERCETLYNKLNTFVASVISRDVTPKISNLNTEVWGSDTQTGNSRIDTLNTNFNNLDSSITTMESDINNVESDVSNLQTSVNSLNNSITNISAYYYQRVSLSSNVWSGGNTLYLHRVGQLVIAIIPSKSLTYGSGYTGWQNMITIPSGFRPISDIPMACINNSSTNYNQWQTNGNYIRVYVGSANTSQFTGAIGVWFTNDDYPSQ